MSEEQPKQKRFQKKPRFLKNREKYADKIAEFDMGASSQVKDGIVGERQVTDMFFGVCFMVFCLVFAILILFGIATGDLNNLNRRADADGGICGIPGNATQTPVNWEKYIDYPFFFIPDMEAKNSMGKKSRSARLAKGVCVKTCPMANEVSVCITNKNTKVCPTATTDTMAISTECSFGPIDLKKILREQSEAKWTSESAALKLKIQSSATSLEMKPMYQKQLDLLVAKIADPDAVSMSDAEDSNPLSRTFGSGWPIVVVSGLLAICLNIGFLKLMSAHPQTLVKVSLAGVEILLIIFILAFLYLSSIVP